VSAEAFLRRVVTALERAQIPYMVTGSFASSAHGVVRGSRDIDIVITASEQQLRIFVAQFPSDQFYANEYDAVDALSHNVLGVSCTAGHACRSLSGAAVADDELPRSEWRTATAVTPSRGRRGSRLGRRAEAGP
jgi:hypothetical protein